LLLKIETSKKLFVLDISDGDEMFIPNDLSLNQLPMSFRYYDPLIQIVQERFSEETLDYFKLSNTVKQECMSEFNQVRQVMEKLGLKESLKEDISK
jgi:hypothetical protein